LNNRKNSYFIVFICFLILRFVKILNWTATVKALNTNRSSAHKITEILFDELVKSQNSDGKEKSSSSRRSNPEEYRGAQRIATDEGCRATLKLDFLRSHPI